MKKILMGMVSILLLCMVLTGCSRSSNTSLNGENKDVVTINFLHWRSEDKAVYEKLISEFEQKNQGIKVQMEIGTSNQDQYYSTLKSRIVGNQPLDVFAVHPNAHLNEYADNMLDLTSQTFTQNYSKTMLESGMVDGKLRALPQAYNMFVIYYNKKILHDNNIPVPTNWEQLEQAVKALHDKNIEAISAGFADSFVFDLIFNPMVSAYYPENPQILHDLETGKAKLTDPPFVKVFETLKKMGEEGFYQKGALGTKYEVSEALFLQGKTAMLLDGTWNMGALKSKGKDIEMGFFTLPAPTGKTIAQVIPAQALGVNAKSKHKEAALKFLAFLSTKDAAATYGNATGQLVCIKDVVPEVPEMKEILNIFASNKNCLLLNLYVKDAKLYDIYLTASAAATAGDDLGATLQKAQAQVEALK